MDSLTDVTAATTEAQPSSAAAVGRSSVVFSSFDR